MDFIDTRVCVICRDPVSPALELSYSQKQITAKDIEEEHGWSQAKWYLHVKYHLKPAVIQTLSTSSEILAQQIIDKVHATIQQLDRLNKAIAKAEKMLGGAPDPSMIKAYVSLEAQLTRTMEFLAKLQGDFKDAAVIKANNVTVEYNNVIGTVIQEACPACKLKFAEKLPTILKVKTDEESA